MRILFKIVALLWMSHTVYAGMIYGVEHVQDTSQQVRYPAYVQMGSFSTLTHAKQLQHQVQLSTKIPVVIQSAKQHYRVIIGPFQNQSALKAFASHVPNKPSRSLTARAFKAPLFHTPVQRKAAVPDLKPIPVSRTKNRVRMPHAVPKPLFISSDRTQQKSHPELSVLLGGSVIPNSIKGQTLQLLPYEIGPYADTFTNQKSGRAFTWGVDARYRFKGHTPSIQNYLFDSLGAGVEFFQITNFNQTGEVLQFNLPEFKNYTYALHLNNIRIMADFDLDLHPIRQDLIPFVEGGIGGARTAVSYTSMPILPVVGPNFTLNNEASWRFAYQAGAGVKYLAKTHMILSLRYLYANMGKVNSSAVGSATTLATPLTISMNTQNVLFGLTYLVE